MAETHSRRLAAILAADIAGYSALMGADEARTVSDLKAHQAVVLPMVGVFGGRIIDTAGDGILAEFSSVVNAVECAAAIQRTMAERNTVVEPARRMQFRIGINFGDVIYDSERIFGDGINVAARLEGIADPGGICVSAKVRDEIDGKMNFAYQDLGDRQLKNIARPVRAYSIRLDAAAAPPAPMQPKPVQPAPVQPAPPLQPEDRPSIAVLPFTNMSGDPEQEYFSDGISDDIITDLSKIAGLTVIARNSSFTYKGRSVDVRTVGRELAVRSVLEGSIRRAGQRVRITAQLVDAATGGHVWAERYDRDLTDIFEVQDDVTNRIVQALRVTLSPAENARQTDGGTSNIDAYDCYLRGRELLGAPAGIGKSRNREVLEQSTGLFMRALELDPGYSQAYTGLSMAYNLDYQNRWSDDPDSSLPLARRYADRAIETSSKEPFARLVSSWAAIFEKDLDRAKSEAETALSFNPNYAFAYSCLGSIHTYSGRPQEAIAAIERAMRLDPAGSRQYLHFLGTAYLLAGNYETAAALLRRRILLVPGTDFTRAVLASALGHLGEVDEARRIWQELREINPKYSFSEHFGRQPFKRKEDVERIAEGLAKAGLLN